MIMTVVIVVGIIVAAIWISDLIREGVDNYDNYDDWNNHV